MNLPENTILLVEVGSTAHGTGLPGGEDQDETAIFIESAQQVFEEIHDLCVSSQIWANSRKRAVAEGSDWAVGQ